MGMLERVKAGLWMGGGNLPYCYSYDRNSGILIPIPERVKQFRLARQMYVEGESPNDIAIQLGLAGEGVVRKMLDSVVNLGMIPYKGEVYEGKHQAITTQDEFDEVQECKEARSNNDLNKSSYLLAGLLYCGKCTAKMRYQKWGKDTIKIYCYSQQTSKPNLVKDPNCDNEKIDSWRIEDDVLKELFKLSLDEEYFNSKITNEVTDVSDFQIERVKEIDRQITNLLDFIANGIAIHETKEKIEKLQKEKENIVKIQTDKSKQEKKVQNFKKKINNISEIWYELTPQEQRALVVSLIQKIIVIDGKIKLVYNDFI